MFDNQVATVCMPGKFAALCRKLTKDQKDIVEKIGLGIENFLVINIIMYACR